MPNIQGAVTVPVYMKLELKAQIELAAAEDRRAVSDWIRVLIEDHLKARKSQAATND